MSFSSQKGNYIEFRYHQITSKEIEIEYHQREWMDGVERVCVSVYYIFSLQTEQNI